MEWSDNPVRDFARYDADLAEDEQQREKCSFCGCALYGCKYEILHLNLCGECIDDSMVPIDEY